MTALKSAVASWLRRRLDVPQVSSGLAHLQRVGFTPALIFDVGAYQGDFALLCQALWPHCHVVCIDVQEAALTRLRARTDPSRTHVVECLLGASAREQVTLHLAETASSVLVERAAPLPHAATYPMRTLDDVVRERGGTAPTLLKLDVQGYELEVLRGGEQVLPHVQVVIAEVNLLELHADVPLLDEVVAWFGQRGWVTYDICGLTRRPLDRALWQADLVFTPRDSPLRTSKRWG